MNGDIQVTEGMADFIGWAGALGQEKVNGMIREHLAEIRREFEEKGAMAKNGWDPIIEPSDGNEQWKQGGDCNLCRRLGYCKKQCRANRELKKITTPFLYDEYLKDCPEAAAKQGIGMTAEDVVRMVQ